MKYIIGLAIAGLVLYNSVYFGPLDEHLAETEEVEFDAKTFVDAIWDNEMLAAYDSAVLLVDLIERLEEAPKLAFNQEAKALGIGNIGYFKVQGEGTILEINEDNILVEVGNRVIEIETEFIFGNAIRDASGLIKLNDYDRTSDFNSISESINEKIRQKVIPEFRKDLELGNQIRFKGALELNKAHLDLQQLEIIPISLQITS